MTTKTTLDKVSLSVRIKSAQKEYLAACGIPAILFLLIQLLYTLSPASCLPGFLSWKVLPFLVLSSGCMYFFLKHSSQIYLPDLCQSLLFTTAYSFCAYGIEQETALSSLLLYAVFPIIFYTFENMLEKAVYLPFILSCTLMLYIQPETGIQTALLLLVLALLIMIQKRRFTPGNVLHLAAIFLFSFGLGAARILFYLAPYIADHKDYSYSGFSYSYLPAIFAGRFFPGVTASRLLTGTSNRMDLYFGILPLLCFFTFFMLKEISFRKKVLAGIFTILLLMMLEFSPVYYIFSLFHITYHSTLKVSFLLIFWMLYLGAAAYSKAKNLRISEQINTFLLFFLLWSISLLWGKHNFLLPMLIMAILLGSLYCFLLSFPGKYHKFSGLLLLLLIGELGLNGYISTNKEFYNTNSSLNTSFVLSEKKTTSRSKSDDNHSSQKIIKKAFTQKQYTSFITKHESGSTTNSLQNLSSAVTLSSKEKEKYCGTLFPDDFQLFNAKAEKLGVSGKLFTPCDYTIHFDSSSDYTLTDEGNHIYNAVSNNNTALSDCYAAFTISLRSSKNASVFQFDNISANLIKLDSKICSGKSKSYVPLITTQQASTNFQILLYQLNETVYADLLKQLESYAASSSQEPSYLVYDYAGIGITILFAMVFAVLFLYDNRQELYHTLYKWKEQINDFPLFTLPAKFAHKNYVYILSFMIPFFLFILTMILGDAMPFGTNSIFDSDGTASTLAAFLDQYYKYINGNRFLSMNIGFGTDLSLSYSINWLSKLYHFLPLSAIIPAIEWMLALCLGLCGLNMTIYMTQRKKHACVPCNDFRLLLPSCIYSLNAYILASRNYPTWYLVLMLFPLVMLAMNNLMEKKQMVRYSLLLGICILAEIQLTMFICIFLVIEFFTYRFTGVKDFFRRGVRFTIASLLGGGCGFVVIFRTLTAYQGSGYSDVDSTFPSLGFHGSFWAQWRKLMLFTPTTATSLNAGDISLYCGIFTLILVGVYFLYHKTPLSDKLRYLIPILILSISYNGQVLSYLWNGLHYQSNCPNRYVFLLFFLLAELSYDGLVLLPKLSHRKLQPVILGGILFFILCGAFRTDVLDHSLLLTLTAFMIYGFLHYLTRNHAVSTRHFFYLFVAAAIFELSCNTFYASSTWNYAAIKQYDDYEAMQRDYKTISSNNNYSRSVYLAMRIFNQGQYYNTGTINSFGSCLNSSQLTLAQQYGFNATANSVYSEYSATPLHTSLSSCRYLLLPIATEHPIYDLKNYLYLGLWKDSYYVYENPNYCALGYYYPAGAVKQNLDPMSLNSYVNDLARIYCGKTCSVYHYGMINYNTDPSAENAFYFTDASGRQITPDEGKSLLDNLSISDLRSSQVKMHINYTVSKDACYYLSAYGLTSLGRLHPGQNSVTINLPNELVLNDKQYNLLQYDKEGAQKLLDVIHKNQLTDIQISNDTITGTSNYEKAGYTIYSLGYSKNWHAYIDGKEVETLNPYDTNLMIPTPAGKHTVTLKFIPQYLMECQIVTLCFWILVLLLAAGSSLYKKFHLQNRQFSVK